MAESTGDGVEVEPEGAPPELNSPGGGPGDGGLPASAEASGLAARIEALFHTVRRPDREQYTNEEVARACREATGESFSTTYLWQLRTGRRDNPTKRHLEALAHFFQVPPAYFFDERQGAEIAKELALLGALRDAGVRSLALRAVGLSPEGLDTVSELVDVIARRDAARKRPSS
ncbi:helix-turn-helix domain-containing protein [Kitasatospora aureofaciens]|uniref:helix-turn-helix domain-containing protein n=1 Tax=Kitasatospora aureofaciens TaxID=1894 RepID=UPI000524883E|nr:helix-turn-helix domain-containing protein [Kitasatospora aureofaciens]HJD82893.1 helix-turn-helix domain-containing protein [Kitasatospora aureofaciens]